MSNWEMSDYNRRLFMAMLKEKDGFVKDLTRLGIHVGVGNPPYCIMDQEPWPCQHERGD